MARAEGGARVKIDRVVVSGRYVDDTAGRVSVNGRPVRLAADGTFSIEIPLEKPGSFELELSAADAAGNSGKIQKRRVRLVSAALRVPRWARTKRPGPAIADPRSGWAKVVEHRKSGIDLVLIPAGSYMRGALASDGHAEGDEAPQHLIRIDKPFYLGRTEVTNEQFRRFRSDHDSGHYKKKSLNGQDQPVVNVTWEDCAAFATKYGFRLPREIEWEYACRAGSKTRWPWGHDAASGAGKLNALDEATKRRFGFSWEAFPFADARFVTAPVAKFKPNDFGLHDMLGNASEWCGDWYHGLEYETFGGARPSPDNQTTMVFRTVRGGNWASGPPDCRSSNRQGEHPKTSNPYYGFRVARDP